jgi:hypothetical protein
MRLGVVAWLVLGGCLDAGPDPGEGTVDEELTSSIYDIRSFGGNIFSQTFNYVTPQGCDAGFVRQSASTRWTSQAGGNCGFTGWLPGSNPADCRAMVQATTGGGWFGGTCETFVTQISGSWYQYAASNTNSAQQNTVPVQISLNAGDTLTVGTCGLTDSTFQGDTFLRLFDPHGTQVALSDDACGGRGSQMTFVVPPPGGFYTVRAGCWSSTNCSGLLEWTIN